MFDNDLITHPIQKYILQVLTYQKFARFRDMRKSGTDSNLYSYHLKTVVKNDFIEKTEKGYRLTANGLMYVDRVSWRNLKPRIQPKIITMILLKNNQNKILLSERDRQPFITRWTFPNGKIHLDDASIQISAKRELVEKTGIILRGLDHVGDCYIKTIANGSIISYVLAHVFYKAVGDLTVAREDLMWTDRAWRKKHKLAPGIEDIIRLSEKRSATTRFFAEFEYKISLS
jgi:8-oxo-dGTP pyrophosphatase MutT (NUDIX family)